MAQPVQITQKTTPQGKTYYETERDTFWALVVHNGKIVTLKKITGVLTSPHEIIAFRDIREFVQGIFQAGYDWSLFRTIKGPLFKQLVSELTSHINGPQGATIATYIETLTDNFIDPDEYSFSSEDASVKIQQFMNGEINKSDLDGYLL